MVLKPGCASESREENETGKDTPTSLAAEDGPARAENRPPARVPGR